MLQVELRGHCVSEKALVYLGQSYMDILILTSLLVSMGISANQQRIYFFAGYLRLAML